MDAIQISHLKKYYSDIKAVDDISFSVKKGDLFGLLGVNGAGKSTTIHILCTLLKATAGTVKICDYDALKEADAIRNKIGVVFQNNTLDDYLTVKENLLMRGFLYEKDLKTVQKNLYEIAEILNIQNLLSRPFRKLSGGQKRRCEIARALMNTPEILFLDEPSTGLDPQTRKLMWDCLESLRLKRHMTIFLTTHYMEEASMAQQLCIMDAGKIIASGSPSQLKNKYASDTLKIFLCQVGTKKILRIYKPFIGGQPPMNGLSFLYALLPFFVRRFLYAASNASIIGVTGSSLSGLDKYSNRMPFSRNFRSNLMKEEVSRLIREVSRVRIVPMS